MKHLISIYCNGQSSIDISAINRLCCWLKGGFWKFGPYLFCLKLGSHCRSDQLDHPDHPNSPIRPDQARLKAYTRLLLDLLSITHDYSRLLHDVNPTTFPISARSSRPLHDPYTISTRPTGSLLDRCQIFPRPDRHGRTRVVEGREQSCTKTFRIKTSNSVDHYHFILKLHSICCVQHSINIYGDWAVVLTDIGLLKMLYLQRPNNLWDTGQHAFLALVTWARVWSNSDRGLIVCGRVWSWSSRVAV